MKMQIIKIAALLMTCALCAISCDEKPDPDNPGGNTDKPEGSAAVSTVEITIDGDFSDWDKITAESAKNDDCLAIVTASSSDPIPVIKANSDDRFLYFYAEILVDALPQNAICSEWGNSVSGTPEAGYKGDGGDNDSFREDFNVFIDPDGNPDTGFLTYANGDEAAIPGLGCEMCAQQMFFYNYQTNKLCIAWNQTNVGPTQVTDGSGKLVDYDYTGDFFQQANWNEEGTFPRYGWLSDGSGDNIAPKPENIKSVVSNHKVRVEFAIDKDDIVNLPDDATRYAWGVCYRFDENIQDIGPIRAAYSE